jgi:hypothetical protein
MGRRSAEVKWDNARGELLCALSSLRLGVLKLTAGRLEFKLDGMHRNIARSLELTLLRLDDREMRGKLCELCLQRFNLLCKQCGGQMIEG